MGAAATGLRIGDPDFVFDSAKRQLPRRIVRLDEESGEVVEVLAEYAGAEIVGSRLHAELQRFARLLKGRPVALEWLGNLGWIRYAACRH